MSKKLEDYAFGYICDALGAVVPAEWRPIRAKRLEEMEESFDPASLFAIGDFPDFGSGDEEEDSKDKAPVDGQ